MGKFCIILALLFAVTIPAGATPTDHKLDDVLVTPGKSAQQKRESSASANVITQRDIQTSNALTTEDLIRTTPGITGLSTGSLGETTRFQIRGSKNNHTQVLIEGFKVNDPATQSFDFSDLDIMGFERVEIVKGPQSAAYGSEAMGGVINFRLDRPKNTQAHFKMVGGSQQTIYEHAKLSVAQENHSYMFSVNRLDSKGDLDNDRFGKTGAQYLSQHNFNTHQFTLFFMGSQSEKDASVDIDPQNLALLEDPNRVRTRYFFTGGLNYHTNFKEMLHTNIRLQSMMNQEELNNPTDDTRDFSEYYKGRTGRYGAQINQQLTLLPFNTIHWGVDYQLDKIHKNIYTVAGEDANPPAASDKTHQHEVAYYLMDRLAISDWLYVNGSLRLHHTKKTPELAPSIGTALWLPTQTKWIGNISKGIRQPSITELYGTPASHTDLDLEKVWSYETGLHQYLMNDRIHLSGTLFYNDYSNIIELSAETMKFENLGEVTIWGQEYAGNIQLFNFLALRSAYTYTDSDQKSIDGEPENDLQLVPKHQIKHSFIITPVESTYLRISHQWRSATNQLFVGFTSLDNKTIDARSKSIQRIDISLQQRITKINSDCRLITATNRPLEKLVQEKKFREDLYFRLKVIPIEMPDLSQRKEDIPTLIRFFIEKAVQDLGKPIKGISDRAVDLLMQYEWPGNIRELENLIERLIVLTNQEYITDQNIPIEFYNSEVPDILPDEEDNSDNRFQSCVDQFQRNLIMHALRQTNGVKTRAAKYLGIPVSTLKFKISKLEMKEMAQEVRPNA
jgi:outer membrane cobalamin receptor